jgi:hypothetical protein
MIWRWTEYLTVLLGLAGHYAATAVGATSLGWATWHLTPERPE